MREGDKGRRRNSTDRKGCMRRSSYGYMGSEVLCIENGIGVECGGGGASCEALAELYP